jgi:stage II sporulation protein D (peptidoglycan lytic transglycosylase)
MSYGRIYRGFSSERQSVGRSVGALLWLVGFGTLAGCQNSGFAGTSSSIASDLIVNVRDVRVLLADTHVRCRIRSSDPIVVRHSDGSPVYEWVADRWHVVRVDGRNQLQVDGRVVGQGVFDVSTTTGAPIELSHPGKKTTWASPRRYAGFMRLSATKRQRLRIVNHVNLEQYVACVLPGELFPHFDREAFRAQAVAARTYALYEMAEKGNKPYDVAATEASQVYPGLQETKAAQRAAEAVRYTRGIVATWTAPEGERIFCTFYSSCCGGRTQTIADFRDGVEMVPPLSGGVLCGCPKISTSYRWGPVKMTKKELTRRIVSRYPKLRNLGRIESVRVIKRTKWGRPTTIRLVGKTGKAHDLRAENFRLACGSRKIRSSNFRATSSGNHIAFTDGKGFGHGMGMCQWGVQEMALRGVSAGKILKHYYPTMNLTRVY